MNKKFISCVLIFFLVLPPTLFLQPKNADAFIVLAARAALSMAVRVGVPKFARDKATIYLKPIAGKLYNATIGNYWTPYVTTAASLHAIAALIPWNQTDSTDIACVNVDVRSTAREPIGGTYAATTLTFGLSMAISDALPFIPSAADYVLSSTSTRTSGTFGLLLPDGTFFSKGTLLCTSTTSVDKTAYDNFMDNVIDIIPAPTTSQLEQDADMLLKAAQDALKNDPNQTVSTTAGGEGLVLEEVSSQTYTDSNGVLHNITRDPNTGELLDNGVPIQDEIVIIDVNGVQHRFTVDPVTGNILDNTNPVGNFAQWTDSEGVTHTVTVDPITGKLTDNNQVWNPDTLPPTATNPSGGTVTVDPYSGQTTVDLPALDLQPLLDAQATAITEQKKTTDAVNKNNDALKDIYSALSDTQQQDKTDRDILNNQLTSIRAIEGSNNYMGLSGFMSRVQNSPFYSSMSNALLVNGATGYPSWSVNQSINIVGQTFTIDAALNTQDYAWMLDSMRVVILLGSGWFAFRRIFG